MPTFRSLLLLNAGSNRERFTRMAAARSAVGLSVGVSPALGGRLFGIAPSQMTPPARLLARLFAVRQVCLAAWIHSVRDAGKDEQRRCAGVNLAVDAADLAILVAVVMRPGLRRAAAMSAVLAGNATLAWAELLQEL